MSQNLLKNPPGECFRCELIFFLQDLQAFSIRGKLKGSLGQDASKFFTQ